MPKHIITAVIKRWSIANIRLLIALNYASSFQTEINLDSLKYNIKMFQLKDSVKE